MNPNTAPPSVIPRTAHRPVLVPNYPVSSRSAHRSVRRSHYPVILSNAKDLPAKPMRAAHTVEVS